MSVAQPLESDATMSPMETNSNLQVKATSVSDDWEEEFKQKPLSDVDLTELKKQRSKEEERSWGKF